MLGEWAVDEGWPQTEYSGSRLWVRAGLRLNTRGVGCG